MRGPACLAAARLVDKRAAGLSAAERVRLESHLHSCATCGDDADALAALASLTDDLPTLSTFAHNRAINTALREPRQARPRTRPRRWLVPVVASASAAIAATLLMFAFTSADTNERSITDVGRPPLARPADHLVGGAIEIAGQPALPGAAIPAQAVITATDSSELVIAHARIALDAGTAVLWRNQDDTLELRDGVVQVSVDPAAGQRFRVATTAFTVEVVGTEFTVARDRVEVRAGRVLVWSPSHDLLAELGAGDEWKPSQVASPPTRTRPRVAAARSPTPPTAAARARDHAAILIRARRALAGGDVAAAKAAISTVLADSPRRGEQAEAHTLRAECALVSGDPELAARGYLTVAKRYADLAAGDNALFAAARLAANAGRNSDADKLLRRYLERYPAGRFTREAKRRLDAID